MLRLFFHRDSVIMKSLFFASFVGTILLFYQGAFQRLSNLQTILASVFLLQVGFAYFVKIYPWYPKNAAGPGITLQFQKALVPIAYLWPLFLLTTLYYPSAILLGFWSFFLLPITAVAFILIYFHWKDPDPSQPNLLSGKH